MICDSCGIEINIGDWPWCPHGESHLYTVNDDCDVYVKHGLCNPDGTPRRYTKKSDMAKEAAKRGLTNHVEHQGGRGGDKSPHTQRFV